MQRDSSPLLYHQWCNVDDYFQDLAVFGLGPLHPGGIDATRELLSIHDWAGWRVLDIGCGNGTTMRLIESMGGSVIGVEPSAFMREVSLRSGVNTGNLIPSTLEELDLGRDLFDAIIVEGVVGFVADPNSCVMRLLSHLNVAGELIVCDWMPHARASNPDYGFVVHSLFNPQAFCDVLSASKYRTQLTTAPVTAKVFSITESEATRRARLFFSSTNDNMLNEAISRKIKKMSQTLSTSIQTERFMLRVKLVKS